MSDAITAAEKAVFDALTDPAAGLAFPVFQHAPQDTPPPINIFGDVSAAPFGEKEGDPDRRISFQILTVRQGEERKPVLQEVSRIAATLDGKKFTVGDYVISCTGAAWRCEMLEDGETYLGTTTVTILAVLA